MADMKIASLYADIGVKVENFVKGAASVKGGLATMALQFATSAAVVDAFGKAVNFVITQASEAELVDSQLNAVLRSTGEAAGMSKDSLEGLAESLAKLSTYDDEAIKSSEALLLTFTGVGKNVFPEATQAILDMSTALGQDLKSSTIQLGKALNDPIAGITALKRVGVSFTDEQRNLIETLVKSGQTMKAQKIILQELSKEFGGSALEATKTYAGQVAILGNEWADLAETIGAKVLPVVTEYLIANRKAREAAEEEPNILKKQITAWGFYYDALVKTTEEKDKSAAGGSDLQASLMAEQQAAEDAAKAEEEHAEALKILEEYYSGVIDGAIEITERNKDYKDSQQEILDKIQETRKVGEELYPWEAEKIEENKEKLEELGQSYFDNQEKFRAAMEEKFSLMAVEQIALSDGIDGFSQAEYEKARLILETQDIATAAAFEEQQAMNILAIAVADGKLPVEEWGATLDKVMEDGAVSVAEVQAAIEAVPKQNTVTFDIVTNGAPPNLDVSSGSFDAPKGTHRTGHASGGSFRVPQSYGYEGFMMGNGDTASAGELITVSNNTGNATDARMVELLERIANKREIDESTITRALTQSLLQVNR